jgi:AbrB family looped-hinge helix DNA binding protein
MKPSRSTRPHRTTVDSGGRVVLPVEYRRAMGLKPGDEVVLVLKEGEVRVMTSAEALRRAQSLLAPHLESGPDLVDELLESRKREAKREKRRS